MGNFEGNSSFSAQLPKLQLAWDSTSLGLLKECPRKYQFNMIEGLQPRAESVHLWFGGLYHKALELYDHLKSAGASHDHAQLQALRFCLEATVERRGEGWRPKTFDEPNKTRLTLARTVVWYLEQFAEDPADTIQLANGKPAVELSFRFDAGFDAVTGEPILFSGHLDRVVEFNSEIWVLDRKTTKGQLGDKFFAGFSPDNQMSLYSMAAHVVYSQPVKGVIIDGAQILVNSSRFQRGFANRDSKQIEEFYADARFYIGLASQFAEADYWPMNDKSCGNYGGCPYREVCGKSPATRDQWAKSLLTSRTWDPLQVRGDI